MLAALQYVLPIVPHYEVHPSHAQLRSVERLAEELVHEWPTLVPGDAFRPLMPEQLPPGPALHIDDLSGVAAIARPDELAFMQDRARLRAGDGDFIATCGPRVEPFERYCEDQLGLGRVEWLHPAPRKNPLHVAAACWTDRSVRRTLLRAIRGDRLHYVHPHLGNRATWLTALLLQRGSRRPLRVIAPPFGLTRLVNDKVWFTNTVQRLFGRPFIPRSLEAYNLASIAIAVRQLAADSRKVVIKIPNAQGGAGNFVLQAESLRGLSVGTIRARVRELLEGVSWRRIDRVLVSSWESDVLHAPSVQTWIPPEADGLPVIEGLYEQIVEGPQGHFIGSRPAAFPGALTDECASRSFLLARLFQRLGYVGRCSLDLLLVGEDLEDSSLEFIECNGRWGGTSGPMTLMNRLFGDWQTRRYGTRLISVPAVERLTFKALLSGFRDQLYNAVTGRGRLVFYNPGGIATRPGIDVLAIGDTREEVRLALTRQVPERVAELAGRPGEADMQGGLLANGS